MKPPQGEHELNRPPPHAAAGAALTVNTAAAATIPEIN